MDIETTLTLAIAGAVLAAAVVIGFVVTNLVRLVRFVGRKTFGPSQRARRVEEALPRKPIHARLADAATTVGQFVAASVAHGFRSIARRFRVLPTPVGPLPVPMEDSRPLRSR